MKICGIICEYNPLHSGHTYQMREARKLSGADTVACVMSGNFVQRGEPAIADKLSRAAHAVSAGADIVLELPAAFALSSAEDFAHYGVKMLGALGAESLCFGSESGDITALEEAARALELDLDFNAQIKAHMDGGTSYPRAVSAAHGSPLFSSPNDLLAIEYLRALQRTGGRMRAYAVKREGQGYNSEQVSGEFISATAARKLLRERNLSDLKGYLPEPSLLEFEALPLPDSEALALPLLYLLRTAEPRYLESVSGVAEGLHHRMKRISAEVSTYGGLLTKLKTKRYTMARLKRALLCALLGITSDIVQNAKEREPYLRVLAVSGERKAEIFSRLSGRLLLPGEGAESAVTDAAFTALLSAERRADALYPLLFPPESRTVKKLRKLV